MKHIQWRMYEPRDEEAVKKLHAEMERDLGRKLDLPDLMEEPVLIALVGETDGVVTHGMFLEAEAEVCVIGRNPLPAKEIKGAEEYLLPVLRGFRIHMARAFVPAMCLEPKKNGKPGALARILKSMGFSREDQTKCASFYRWVG